MVGAARGFGRNGWGAALLMRDVGDHLVPEGDEPVSPAQHAAFVDHLAELSAHFWGWTDTVGLTPPTIRWAFFGDGHAGVRAPTGAGPTRCPAIADRGWRAFAERAPADVRDAGRRSCGRAPWLLAEAVAATPSTFLHGDWKMGNLGSHPDGRTILLDCAYPGEGPACHELGWYLAINRARLPESKEATIERFRPRWSATASTPPAGGTGSSTCACSARSSSSAGRRRSATTTSCELVGRPGPRGREVAA